MTYKQRAVIPLRDRIMRRVEVAPDGCWLWTGALAPNGYGIVQKGRRAGTTVVHKAMWQLDNGPVPDGLELDHLCRVRRCCNPAHLEPVTRQTNVDRGLQAAGKQRRTECINGHPFTSNNTITTSRQLRSCRTCQNRRNREYRARKKATR